MLGIKVGDSESELSLEEFIAHLKERGLAGGALPQGRWAFAQGQRGPAGFPPLPQGLLVQDLEHQPAGAGEGGN